MSYSNVYFILFKPQLSENIGACARALKNFNFKNLRLVLPKINYPNEKVLATSVGARNVINSSKVFDNFEDSIKDINCVIATSSRLRKKNYKYLSISDLNKLDFNRRVGIVIGPEASGLANNEMSYANYVIKLPTNKKFQSLNISHCVILLCYELFKILDEGNSDNFNKYYSNRIVRTKMINRRSKLNYFIFHISNPILVLIRNIVLKIVVNNKKFLNKYLGQIYLKNN